MTPVTNCFQTSSDDPDTLVKESAGIYSVQDPIPSLCNNASITWWSLRNANSIGSLSDLFEKKKKKRWPTFQEPVQLCITGLQIKWGLMFQDEVCLVHTVLSHSINFKTQPSKKNRKYTEAAKVDRGDTPGNDCCNHKKKTRPGLGHSDS